jgi:transposase-like protein
MRPVHRQYSPELKQRIVDDIESGQLSVREAAQDTQATVTMVQKWVVEFGRFKPKRDIVEVVMKSEQARIAALEKALAEAHLTVQVYDELIAQANKHFKTDLKKSFGMGPFGPASTSTSSPSAPSVRGSAARGMPTTSAAPRGAPPAARPARPKR